MKISIEIQDYDGESIDVIWEDGGEYDLRAEGDDIVLSANKIAMRCFAKQLLYFAENNIPHGSHIHFGSFFCKGLKEGHELIIEEIK